MKIMEQVEDEHGLPELPSEVWMHIISRLPVRTICQFRCVSKTWCNMISDRSSANLFRVKTFSANLVILGKKSGTSQKLFMAEFSCTGASTSLELYDLGCEYGPIASCNGLVLLIAYQDVNPITYCVSNPIIGQYMKLPFPKDIKGSRYFCGFGFCPTTKKYKVIQFHNRRNKDTVVEIHTLGTYAWRDTQIIPPEHLDSNVRNHIFVGTYLNGAIYWMVLKGDDVFIYCFDLENERFSTIVAPEFEVRKDLKFFGATDGHLYISVKFCDVLDVWVMKDFELTSSWTKVLSISNPFAVERFGECAIEVINYADGLDVMILGCYDTESLSFFLVACDLKADSQKVVGNGIEVIRSIYHPFAHVPNFTSLSDVVTGDTYQLKFGYLSKKYCLSY